MTRVDDLIFKYRILDGSLGYVLTEKDVREIIKYAVKTKQGEV